MPGDVVDAGNDRQAQDERRISLRKPLGMAQDRRLIDAGVPAVQRGIRNLPVHQDQLAARHGFFKDLVRRIAAGFDRRRNAVQPVDHLADKRPLHQRFAAGKRHPASGHGVDVGVLAQPPRQILRRPSRPGDLPQPLRAGGHARAAGDAPVRMRADRRARPAMRAGGVADHQLRLRAQPFGVVAPLAAQRAALHEHRRPDARAVEHGEFLDVKYDPVAHTFSSARRMM